MQKYENRVGNIFVGQTRKNWIFQNYNLVSLFVYLLKYNIQQTAGSFAMAQS